MVFKRMMAGRFSHYPEAARSVFASWLAGCVPPLRDISLVEAQRFITRGRWYVMGDHHVVVEHEVGGAVCVYGVIHPPHGVDEQGVVRR